MRKSSNLQSDLENVMLKEEEERIAIAKDSNTSSEILEILASDKSLLVRLSLLENENLPFEVLIELESYYEGDENESDKTREAAREYIAGMGTEELKKLVECIEYYIKTEDDKCIILAHVLFNEDVPVEYLKKYATHYDEFVRYAVAGNANTPVEILTALAADSDSDVRENVVDNPNAPDFVVAIAQNYKR